MAKTPKMIVLEKIWEMFAALHTPARSDDGTLKRLAAWDVVRALAVQLEVIDDSVTRDYFRNHVFRGWKSQFQVCVISFTVFHYTDILFPLPFVFIRKRWIVKLNVGRVLFALAPNLMPKIN